MRLLLQGNRESTRTLGYLGVDVLYCRYRPTDWNMQCCGECSFEAPVTVIVILGVVAAATGAEDSDFPRCLAIGIIASLRANPVSKSACAYRAIGRRSS